MGEQGSLYHMLCEICISHRSASTHNLEETVELFIPLRTRDSKNGCQSKSFSWMMKLNKTQSSTHTLQWDTPFCPAGLWSENQARKWQSVAWKRSFLYLTNYFSDRNSMTKYPFSHNSIHLQVNSDQTIPGKHFKWNQTGDKERSL